MKIKNCIRVAFLMAFLELILIAFIAFFLFTHDAHAGDISTWRYGSPGDVRHAGIRAAARGDQIATARWMDIVFRAGSPQLYRYTMRPGRQVNVTIINNQAGATSSAPAQIVDYGYSRGISHRSPRYPAPLVP